MKTIEKTHVITSATLLLIIAFIVFVLLTLGCTRERIEGNYDLVTEERASQEFTQVLSNGSFNVTIIPDLVTRVAVKAESNILPYLYTDSDGDHMIIGFKNGYNIREHYMVEVFLHTPTLKSISLSGSGRVESGKFYANDAYINLSGSGNISCAFEAEDFHATISGSGNLTIEGSAKNSYLKVSGSGNISAFSLAQQNCRAEISGSGNIKASVSDFLEAWISGSGKVYYQGDPDVITHISGSGNVIRY